ncbi:ribonuclease HI family protein [Listeria fleischmannii]|jgi:ribonuclease HI|uniref:Ribonuclease HI family protein n=1 Tax=Listeria fleischmannii TaxID=1069827 RepID=A0A841YHQ6_9LIST|nr:ribonuclease HI family protein [Listeria fleischmannii]MBC1399608.1 ribonuclease HI family protein [Listeria fleischmannii]MBC1418488.1 ribonuclease HI family protein [Listeria fleischmannii]MBC1427879.1 ribonuclease HI family protein [Listeria fleischmannii]STY35491.1 14.7 kDa ribonuclease H-like protein [Listeria fleischmannii subsp. coloradonensis]
MDVFVDGASSGNPGLSGAGVVLKSDQIYEQHALPIGILTNHEAEFIACKIGLELALTHNPDFVRLYTDSKIVIDSVEKRYAKNPLFKPHLDAILQLAELVPLFYINYRNVSQNKKADELARQAIQLKK